MKRKNSGLIFEKLLRDTVYNHEFADLAIETNSLEECLWDLRNWCKELQDQKQILRAALSDILENLLVKDKHWRKMMQETLENTENITDRWHWCSMCNKYVRDLSCEHC